MKVSSSPTMDQVHALLAEKGYEVTPTAADTIRVAEVSSGLAIQAVLQEDILFLSLVCTVVPESSVTAEAMARMLAANNGISTSSFQLYEAGDDKVAITLNNFCKLQDMGPEDEDDVLSCVQFLLVDVVAARQLLGTMGA